MHRLVLLLQVLGQGELRIFDEGQTLLSRGYPHTQQVFILLRGHITMHLADGRTFTAGTHLLHMTSFMTCKTSVASQGGPALSNLSIGALHGAAWCLEHRPCSGLCIIA